MLSRATQEQSMDSTQQSKPERVVIGGWKALNEKTKRSRQQTWRDIRAGNFPAPFELGPNSVGWFEDEVDEWLASRPRRNYRTADTIAA